MHHTSAWPWPSRRSVACLGACAVAVFPGMGEYPEDREQVTEAYRLQAKEKIAALWESIGFQLFRRGVWLRHRPAPTGGTHAGPPCSTARARHGLPVVRVRLRAARRIPRLTQTAPGRAGETVYDPARPAGAGLGQAGRGRSERLSLPKFDELP